MLSSYTRLRTSQSKLFQMIQKIFRNVTWEFPDVKCIIWTLLYDFLLPITQVLARLERSSDMCVWLLIIFLWVLFNIFIASEMQVAWVRQTKNCEIHLSKWSGRVWSVLFSASTNTREIEMFNILLISLYWPVSTSEGSKRRRRGGLIVLISTVFPGLTSHHMLHL